MPRKLVKKEKGIFEKESGLDIWWIRYYIDGRERREKVGRRGDALKLGGFSLHPPRPVWFPLAGCASEVKFLLLDFSLVIKTTSDKRVSEDLFCYRPPAMAGVEKTDA